MIEKILKVIRTLVYRWRVVLHDLLMIPVAWLGAYWLRYNLDAIPNEFLQGAYYALPAVIAIQLSINLFVGVHRSEWRFVSLPDLSLILRATILGTVMIAFIMFVTTRLLYVPRSVFILYALILVGVMCSSRLLYRLIKDRHFSTGEGRKVVILGAGAAGEQLVRDLRRNYSKQYNSVAFLDDDKSKIGRQIHRVPVVASCEIVSDLVLKWGC